MKSPKNITLYSRLALITSVSLVIGYFVVYAAWTTLDPIDAGPTKTLTATLMQGIVNNINDLNTRVSNFGFNGGNIGIGTASPLTKLHLSNTGNGTGNSPLIRLSHENADGAGANISWYYGDNTAASGRIETVFSTADNGSHLGFYTQNNGIGFSERMRISSIGNVGIGTASPVGSLEVERSQNAVTFIGIDNPDNTGNVAYSALSFYQGATRRAFISSINDGFTTAAGGSGTMQIWNFADGNIVFGHTTGGVKMTIRPTGSVGIGVIVPTQKLDVDGNIKTSGCLYYASSSLGTCASDEQIKKDITPFNLGLDTILGLQPKHFKYNGLGGLQDDGIEQIGVIAQDVEKIAPSLIKKQRVQLHPNDQKQTEIKAVDYGSFTYLLINAVKELSHKLDSLFVKYLSQQDEINELKSLICLDHPNAEICR